MARMIPPDCPPEAPRGEAILYHKLRDAPGTDGWVILHSLELRRHRNKVEGEIDMVILAPGLGVLCLEVKGCEVARRDGLWIYPYGTSKEGPFRQASSAMHSLRDYIEKRDVRLSGLLFFSAVAFSRVHFNEESPEWHSWQVIDISTLNQFPISQIFSRIFEQAHRHISSGIVRRGWYNDQTSRPTALQVSRLTSLLRGNFEFIVQPRCDVQRVEESLLRLTEEQYEALDAVQGNDRIVIKGLAGTGKTFLAIEAARRAVRAGKRVLLLCFNRLLADWMVLATRDFTKMHPGMLRVVHLHGLLLEIARNHVAINNDHGFWKHELPSKVVEYLLDNGSSFNNFDLLVVDEAQDILTDDYLDVLDLLVSNGLSGGDWVFFGDFERQVIYLTGAGSAPTAMLECLRKRTPHHANFTLRVNCRNAAPIAETLTLACNVRPGYSRYLHDMEGAGVDLCFWADSHGQEMLLTNCISELHGSFQNDEIVILSLNADDRSCAGNLARVPGKFVPLRQLITTDTAAFRYASVHAFKGLEAPAIILTDIKQLDEQTRALLYVGMSRARVRLILLMHETCRKEYDRMLEAGLVLTTGRSHGA